MTKHTDTGRDFERSAPGGAQAFTWGRGAVLFSDVAAVLVKRAWLVIGIPLAMGIFGFLFFQLRGSFMAESSLTPEEPASNLAQFAGLAARFGGVAGLAGQTEASIDFYSEVLRSPALLAEVVQTPFRFAAEPGGSDTISGTLVRLYGLGGDTPADSVRNAVNKLRGRIAIRTDRLANVLSISVKAPWRELSQQVNRRMLDALSEFNLQKRQSRARAQRLFTEERLNLARAELTASEDSLRLFLERNRTYQASPRLAFDAARLQRRIEVRQQVYTTLVQAFEQSRIDEVRDTPVFTIIQRPELFTKRSRNPVVMGFLAMTFWAVVCVTLALFLEYIEQERRLHPENYERLRNALAPIRRLAFWRRRRA